MRMQETTDICLKILFLMHGIEKRTAHCFLPSFGSSFQWCTSPSYDFDGPMRKYSQCEWRICKPSD